MNLIRLLVLFFLLVITFLVTNMPNFHLDGYIGLPNSTFMGIASHAGYYFVMSLSIFILFHNLRIPVLLVYFLFSIPALFEFSQGLMPGRTVSIYDMLGNYIGLAVGLSIGFLLRHFMKTKVRPKH